MSNAIEDVSRKTAGRYVTEAMVDKRVHPKTARKDISALSVYWRWLIRKGYTETNVWERQAPPKPKLRAGEDRPKRPYTDDEVSRLFSGITDPLVLDAMTVAALSGLRVEEIARLRVEDCSEGVFNIREAKTAAGVRRVPIHTELARLVAKRMKGKAPTDKLFHELPTPRPGSPVEAGQTITKRFGRLRVAMGVDDRIPGARQSRIDFHSFRRWFARKAQEALHAGKTGFSPFTLMDVLGHDREGVSGDGAMTFGRYAGRDGFDAMKACVEAVRLPLPQKTQ